MRLWGEHETELNILALTNLSKQKVGLSFKMSYRLRELSSRQRLEEILVNNSNELSGHYQSIVLYTINLVLGNQLKSLLSAFKITGLCVPAKF